MSAPPIRTNGNIPGPRRRLSYLIPPPPASQPPPFLTLPEPNASRRGNPNPLIILANSPDLDQDLNALSLNGRERTASDASSLNQGSLSSRTSSRSGSQGQALSHSHSHSPWTQQRHPEHTLGITSLALDTSTVIETSSGKHAHKKPAGILYSGGKDGLVASWELGLPFKKRENAVSANGSSVRSRYRPRWSEETYESEESSSSDEDEGEGDTPRSDDEDEQDRPNYLRNGRQGSASSSDYMNGTSPPNGVSGYRSIRRPENGLHLDFSGGPDSAQRKQRRGAPGNLTIVSGQHQYHRLPYEYRWQIDERLLDEESPPSTMFRQAHRGHTDWINDLLLCNLNQTVISASSDRMIRAWNPHDPDRSMLPASLGSHSDYVKCLAHGRQAGWVGSGGLDKRIKLWDILESREAPIVDYSVDASVYALATNTAGNTIVSGSPGKVVNVHDPRVSQSVARLIGHADNVRSLLLSEDGRHVLSASSDATVKLWSVSMQRCLHTFTMHSDSVWSLFSSHPHLEVFYSGDRTGTVCKTDFTDCGDIASEGECVILLRNRDELRNASPNSNDGITRMVAVDDAFIWTASGSSNICRWRDVPPRLKRMAATTPRRPAFTNQESLVKAATTPGPSSPLSVNGSPAVPIRDTTGSPVRGSPLNDRGGLGHSVAFASTTVPSQRSSPGPSSSLQHRPSSLRYSSRPISTSTTATVQSSLSTSPNHPLHPIASSPNSFDESSASPRGGHQSDPQLPSMNQIPLESLVPLFTPDDPYSRSSGYNMRQDGSGAVGYSASVLSLHRTISRPAPGLATSPFSSTFPSVTPPSSNLSAPRAPMSFRNQSPIPNYYLGSHKPSSIAEDDEETPLFNKPSNPPSEAVLIAQQEYEDREFALDGIPLRSVPDDVIRGRHGLVKSELLNDRRTVISLDTFGEVAVWDIVLGGCIGRFSPTALKPKLPARYRNETTSTTDSEDAQPQEDILEIVRKRIEGEAVVAAWCSVETKTGLLTVHIEQNRAFDAEVYLDEAGVPPKPGFKVDQRLNLGKWVLRNIFDGFIKEEIRKQARGVKPGSLFTSASSVSSSEDIAKMSISQRTPSQASIAELVDSHEKHFVEGDSRALDLGALPAGFSTALATPAMTPAILPDMSDRVAQMASPRLIPAALMPSSSTSSALPTIPQSPGAATAPPLTPLSTLQKEGDYFSRPRANPAAETPSGTQTPKPVGTVPPTPGSSSPLVKTSKMGRFKSFGKKDAKRDLLPDVVSSPNADRKEEVPVEVDPLSHLTQAQKEQTQLLQAMFAHPLQPSPWLETPHIRFVSDLSVMIGEESVDAGAWATIYRGLVSRVAADAPLLEMSLPAWMLEFALHNVVPPKEPVKIAFVLEPWGGPQRAGLPALPSGNARLSATRMLRMRKACHYVAERLELESWKQRQQYQTAHPASPASTDNLSRSQTRTSLSSSQSFAQLNNHDADEPTLLPEDEVEILCNDQIVPLNITLAACARYCYGKSGDVPLMYRRRIVQNAIPA